MSLALSNTDGTLTVHDGPQQLAEDLYDFTGSFKAPIPGISFSVRMTVMRIPGTRDLVVFSPFKPSLVDVSSLGVVKAVIVPNALHSSYAHEFVAAHPGSALYSSPSLVKRFPGSNWGTILDDSCAPDVVSPHVLVRMLSSFTMFQEVVALHVSTRSIVVADLASNYSKAERAKMNFGGWLLVHAIRATRQLDWNLLLRYKARSCCDEGLPQLDELLGEWDWDRFVPCHGAVVDKGAKAIFREGTYKYVKSVAERDSGRWKSAIAFGFIAIAIGVTVSTVWRRV